MRATGNKMLYSFQIVKLEQAENIWAHIFVTYLVLDARNLIPKVNICTEIPRMVKSSEENKPPFVHSQAMVE